MNPGDFGIAYGVNLHVSERVSFGLEVDITAGIGMGPDRKSTRKHTLALDFWTYRWNYIPYASSANTDREFARAETTAKISVIFRVGDTYAAEGSK